MAEELTQVELKVAFTFECLLCGTKNMIPTEDGQRVLQVACFQCGCEFAADSQPAIQRHVNTQIDGPGRSDGN